MAGNNGTPVACSTSPEGVHTALVHFPDPAPNGRDETYDPVPDAQHADFLFALANDLKVDTTGSPGTVTTHK
jgi:hypothetical protein